MLNDVRYEVRNEDQELDYSQKVSELNQEIPLVYFLSFFLYILSDPLSSIMGRCTLYTPGKG